MEAAIAHEIKRARKTQSLRMINIALDNYNYMKNKLGGGHRVWFAGDSLHLEDVLQRTMDMKTETEIEIKRLDWNKNQEKIIMLANEMAQKYNKKFI